MRVKRMKGEKEQREESLNRPKKKEENINMKESTMTVNSQHAFQVIHVILSLSFDIISSRIPLRVMLHSSYEEEEGGRGQAARAKMCV